MQMMLQSQPEDSKFAIITRLMGYIEHARKIIEHPALKEDVEEERKEKNNLYRLCFSEEISLVELRTQLSSVEERSSESTIELPWIGPLYGLLRKIGISRENVKEIVIEEKDHYFSAQTEGIQINGVDLIFFQDSKTGINYVQPFLSFNIPEGLSDQETRNKLKRFFLAPEDPSPDDLAKIP